MRGETRQQILGRGGTTTETEEADLRRASTQVRTAVTGQAAAARAAAARAVTKVSKETEEMMSPHQDEVNTSTRVAEKATVIGGTGTTGDDKKN